MGDKIAYGVLAHLAEIKVTFLRGTLFQSVPLPHFVAPPFL
jgi:hypothetical protein